MVKMRGSIGQYLKQFQLLRALVKASRLLRNFAVDRCLKLFLLIKSPAVRLENSADEIIVSLTSFPARLPFAWASIESIMQQSRKPGRVILVLASPQFPQRRLPYLIRWQVFRGLEIRWVNVDSKSFKKLIPVLKDQGSRRVVTVDDDVIYDQHLLEVLSSEAMSNPECVIGTRGWAVTWENGAPTDYLGFKRPSNRYACEDTLLTGVGGIMYPPSIFNVPDLCDYETARKLCPTADDIWFWSVLRAHGYKFLSLEKQVHRENFSARRTVRLTDVNWHGGGNNAALRAVAEYLKLEPIGSSGVDQTGPASDGAGSLGQAPLGRGMDAIH